MKKDEKGCGVTFEPPCTCGQDIYLLILMLLVDSSRESAPPWPLQRQRLRWSKSQQPASRGEGLGGDSESRRLKRRLKARMRNPTFKNIRKIRLICHIFAIIKFTCFSSFFSFFSLSVCLFFDSSESKTRRIFQK